MKVTNVESWFFSDVLVDVIIIPLSVNLRANSEYGSVSTQYGYCGRAYLTLKIRITSDCPPNMYGSDCNTKYTEVSGRRFCNYLGDISPEIPTEEYQGTCSANNDFEEDDP